MREVPPLWAPIKLAEIAEFVMGQAPPGDSQNFEGAGVPFVKAGEFSDVRPVIREWTTRPLKFAREGDLLICVVGATAGKLNLGADCAIGRSVAAIRPFGGTTNKFLYYYLLPKVLELRKASVGSAQGVISRTLLSEIDILLPPVAEQERIVARIDELFSDIDAGVANLKRAQALLKRYRQSVLNAAVTGELTRDWRGHRMVSEGLPSTWTRKPIGDLAQMVQYGSSARCESDLDGVPVLRMGNIVDGKIEASALKFLPRDHREFPDLLLRPGDLLFNRTNSAELVGKTAVYKGMPKECSFASYLIRVRLRGMIPELVAAYINSSFGRNWVRTVVSQQVGQANVNGAKLKALEVPVPPSDEQCVIVERMESALSLCDAAIGALEKQGANASALRQSILRAAFSGRLVPQDPTDEPASALLARIRAARATAPGRGGRVSVPRRRTARAAAPAIRDAGGDLDRGL